MAGPVRWIRRRVLRREAKPERTPPRVREAVARAARFQHPPSTFLASLRAEDPTPISLRELATISENFGVDPAAARAVLAVEANWPNRRGFNEDGRPLIRFERHKFGQYSDHLWSSGPDARPLLSRRTYSAWAPDSQTERWGQLHMAYELHPEAALYAVAWGLPQIQGFNHSRCGFDDVERFVRHMCESERAQVLSMFDFCQSAGLIDALRRRDWERFAAGYNGTRNVRIYAPRLARAYRPEAGSAWA